MSFPSDPHPQVPDSEAVKLVAAVPMKTDERDALLIDMHGRLSYIQAKVETLPDHEDRIRKLERRVWGVPGSMMVALMAALGFHIH